MRQPANPRWASDLQAFANMKDMEQSIYDSLDKIEARDCFDQIRDKRACVDEFRVGLDERERSEEL